MKRIILSIATLLISIYGIAQITIDRSEKPEPGPTKEIKIGDYEKFSLKNGLKVIVVENHKLPRVSFQLIIDRDPLTEGDKVGYISMAGDMLRRGTTNRTKEEIDLEIDFIGASLSTSATSIYASSLTKHKDKLLDVMTDVLYNPTFPEEELEKVKKQTISGLKSAKDDPGSIALNVSKVLRYGADHPYGELQREEHVENIEVADLKEYYDKYFIPNISYLAIVGDITPKEAKKIAKARFGNWEKGEALKFNYEMPVNPDENQVAIVDRPSSVQTVIRITYPIELKPGSESFIKATVMNQILGGSSAARLFKNIREDKGFTYGAYSNISSDRVVGSFTAYADVRNEVTDSAIVEFLNEMEFIRNQPPTDEELNLAKNVLIGSFGRSLESPQTVAGFAVSIERYGLSPDYYNNYVKNISAVTKEDVMSIAKKYIRPESAYILSVGKAADIAGSLQKFGTLSYYNMYGEEVDPNALSLPEDLSAADVMNKYFNALGGREKLEKINSIKMVMTAEAMGNPLKFIQYKQVPNNLYIKIEMAGNAISEQIYDGTNAKVVSRGSAVPITDEQKMQLMLESPPIPELKFEEMGVKTALVDLEDLDGTQAVNMEVTNPDGKTYNLFFDMTSGLLIKKTEVADGGDIRLTTEILDYQEQDGVLLPAKIMVPLGPQLSVEATTETVEINGDIPAGLFNTQ